jgi:hypothetical protein
MLTTIIALFMLGCYKNSRIPTSWNSLVKSPWDQLFTDRETTNNRHD